MIINGKYLVYFALMIPLVAIAEEPYALEPVAVQAQKLADQQRQSHQSKELAEQASGSTLGDYLSNQPNVSSASYGPAVGRPVVRGMTGYRVKILQNDIEVSDMSAMSADHAVAVVPQASQRIELLKGPASILYGASSGGSVRLISSADSLPEKGLQAKINSSLASNNNAKNLSVDLTGATDRFSINLFGLQTTTDNYTDGNGNEIKHSDVLSKQLQLSLGWQYREQGNLQFLYQHLHKDYGIPNDSSKETRIDMATDSYSLKLVETELNQYIDQLKFIVQHDNYLHDETEGASQDGLYGQQKSLANLQIDYVIDAWFGSIITGYSQAKLQVCHEHGACEDFSRAIHTGIPVGQSYANYLNATGIPFRHGNPMPDTNDKKWHLSMNGEREISAIGQDDDATLSLGFYTEVRNLTANSANIQETWLNPDASYYKPITAWANSLSFGWQQALSAATNWSLNLSYLERLPSADELYWNGYHHATDSYVIGNRNLNKERSLNLDWDLSWQPATAEMRLNLFYYQFANYIYQNKLYNGDPVQDPFHLSDVWETLQDEAIFYGGSVAYDWNMLLINQTPLQLTNQFEMINAELQDGSNLPRTAPMSWLIGVNYTPENWSVKLNLKHVFKASNLASNEQSTDSYNWLNLYTDWQPEIAGQSWKLWFKADNLLDEYAENHISFLKTTAPLTGRQFSLGVELMFY